MALVTSVVRARDWSNAVPAARICSEREFALQGRQLRAMKRPASATLESFFHSAKRPQSKQRLT